MLVPVVAFNADENAGYIKLGNDLIMQWGRLHSDDNSPDVDGKGDCSLHSSKAITFPLCFTMNNCNILLRAAEKEV